MLVAISDKRKLCCAIIGEDILSPVKANPPWSDTHWPQTLGVSDQAVTSRHQEHSGNREHRVTAPDAAHVIHIFQIYWILSRVWIMIDINCLNCWGHFCAGNIWV